MVGRSRLLFTVVFVLSTLIFASAAAPPPPAERQGPAPAERGAFTQGSRPSPDWLRIRTTNFEAVGNAPADSIRQILVQLEVYRSMLVTKVLGLGTSSSVPTLVVVLKDEAAFDRFRLRDLQGRKRTNAIAYFTAQPDINLIVMPALAHQDDSLRVACHEYFHFVLSRNMPTAPAWLSEGLSELYSSFSFDPVTSTGTIGVPVGTQLDTLRGSEWLLFDDLLVPEKASRILSSTNPRPVALFYAQSWALVHYLVLDGSGQSAAKIRVYLAAIEHGTSPGKAFLSAFGIAPVDLPRLLGQYVHRSGLPGMSYQWDPAGRPVNATSSPLTEAEAEYVQGDLLMRLDQREDAERALTRAMSLDPAASAPRVSLGILRWNQGRREDAIDTLEPIAAAEPGNLRSHLALAEAYYEAKRYEEALGEFSRVVAIDDQSSSGWFGRALAALALGRIDESDAALARLQLLAPDPAWYRTMAYQAFYRGQFAATARNARSYLEKAGTRTSSAPYMAFLGSVCLRRLGRPADADAILAGMRPELARGSWQARMMDFLQGRLDADPFLAAAKNVDQQTEAHAYLAFTLLAAGKRDEAVAHLRWVTEHGTRTFYEYKMAVADLERLEQKPPNQR